MQVRMMACALAILACSAAAALPAAATTHIAKKMNYQGYLTDNSGNPINGTRNLRFRLYDASGNPLNWVETHQNVPIVNGIFNVVLGASAAVPFAVNETFREPYYLEILVDHTGGGSWETMSPRHLLTNAAYAMAARKVIHQQTLVVAHDGGDTTTVSGAIDMLMGAGAFTGAAYGPLSPAPSVSTQWVIEVRGGRFQEPGTQYPSYDGNIHVPNWVTIRGQGWNATELYVQFRSINLADGAALESLMISSDANPVVAAAGTNYPYVRECKIEYASDSSAPAIDISGANQADVVDTTIYYASFMGQVTGVLAGGSQDCRVENCVVDIRQANNMGSAGITDGGSAAIRLFVLENTIMYASSGAAGSSIGIGVAGGGAPSTGRVSYNVLYNGNATYDFWDTSVGAPIAPGYGGPNGIANQDSAGAQVPAF